jgi:hypothetical protein
MPESFISDVVWVNNAKSMVNPIITFRKNHNKNVKAKFINIYILLRKV